MSLLAGLVVVGPAMAAAYLALWVQKRRDHRADAAQPRRLPGRRYVDAPGFPEPPQPLVHRVPGATIATYRNPTDADIQRSDLAPDNDTGPDNWCAAYPPGSLGPHPEQIPDVPGRMTVEDTLSVVAAASRITRAAAASREAER